MVTNLGRAETAVSEKKWEVAYRFLEDLFIPHPEIAGRAELRAKALGILQAHPEILVAGNSTFSAERIQQSLRSYTFEAGVKIEMKRLVMYREVATPENYKAAAAALQPLIETMAEKRSAEQKLGDEKMWAEQKLIDEKTRPETARLLAIQEEHARAKTSARFVCKDLSECDKAFALTQILGLGLWPGFGVGATKTNTTLYPVCK